MTRTKSGTSKSGTHALPPLPPCVDTVLGPVPVVIVPKLRAKRKEGGKVQLFGRYRALARTIEISAEATPVMQWQTLFHELAHAVLSDAGLHNAFTDEQQEIICDVVATARVAEILAALRL